jgi:hypothetical protein
MLLAMAASTVLVLLTVIIHYEALRLITDLLPRLRVPPRLRILAVIFGAFFAHTVEIWMFAFGLYFVARDTGVGALEGIETDTFAEYLYFSTTTFTSLGLGDVWPRGGLRLLVGVEALTGLVLIGWTVSYTYLAMRELWDMHPRRRLHPHRQHDADGVDRPGGHS